MPISDIRCLNVLLRTKKTEVIMVLSDLKDLLFQISENKIIYQYSNSTLDDTSTHWLKISTKQQNNLKRNTRVVYDKKTQKKPLQNSEF